MQDIDSDSCLPRSVPPFQGSSYAALTHGSRACAKTFHPSGWSLDCDRTFRPAARSGLETS